MKYCSNCGNPMQDDMLFCSNCGTKAVTVDSIKSNDLTTDRTDPSITYDQTNYPADSTPTQSFPNNTKVRMRKGMKAGMIVCLVFAFFNIILAISSGDILFYLGATIFFLVLALMFLILGKSTKENPYILNKTKGLKKSILVIICIILAFLSLCIFASFNTDQKESTVPSSTESQETKETESTSTTKPAKTTTLSDVQAWYEEQIPAVGDDLKEYAQSMNGVSDLYLDLGRFYFGGDFNNCYYKFSFHCKVNGVIHTGEARAFLKYKDDSVKWFSFEIFGNDSIQSVIELYDDSYDQIIENYYKELVSNYS